MVGPDDEPMPLTVGLDSMCSRSMVNNQFAKRVFFGAAVYFHELKPPWTVSVGGNHEVQVNNYMNINLRLCNKELELKCGVIPLPKDIDVIVSWADIIKFKLWNELVEIANKECIIPMEELSYEEREEMDFSDNLGSLMVISLVIKDTEAEVAENDSGINHLRLVFPRVFVKDLAKDGAKDVSRLVIRLKKGMDYPKKAAARRQSDVVKGFIRTTVEDWLDKGIIKASISPTAAPIHVVRTPNREWRMCTDYRDLNSNIEDLLFPLPSVKGIIEGLKGSKYFTKFDLRKGYLQTRVHDDCTWLTSFITEDGQYEFNRTPFGLKTAVAFFQRLMSEEVLKGLIGVICQCYIDDIVVYAETLVELHAREYEVLTRLDMHDLRVNEKKCMCAVQKLKFLGYVISSEGVELDPEKKQGLVDLVAPTNVGKLRSFLGLANYFSDFIPRYSQVAAPLTRLTQKAVPWNWDADCAASFAKIKSLVMDAPLLHYIDYTQPIVLRTDASQIGAGCMLYNLVDGKEKPIAFASHKFEGHALNWSTYDQEAYAIFHGLRKWCHLLLGHFLLIETDHRNLAFILGCSDGRVGRWRLLLQEFNYAVKHIQGVTNVVADALSRCFVVCLKDNTPILNEFTPVEIHRIIKTHHNDVNGHLGITATVKRMQSLGIHWNTMREDVVKYIQSCGICQKFRDTERTEIARDEKVIEAYEPWEEIALDSIVDLPEDSEGNKHILVVIDNFSRYIEVYACQTLGKKETFDALLDIFSRYGLPKKIRSDMGGQFVAEAVKQLYESIGAEPIYTIGYRPQANGQVERVNGELMRHLRAIVLPRQNDLCWSRCLPMARRIVNATTHSAIGVAPVVLINPSVNLYRGLTLPPEGGIRTETSVSDWIVSMRGLQINMIKDSQLHLARVLDKRIKERKVNPFELGKKLKVVEVGKYVLCNNNFDRKRGKLDTPWWGPYLVVACEGNNITIKDLCTGRLRKVDVSVLKVFIHHELTEDELRVLAQEDVGECLVKEVIDHRVTPGRERFKKSYEFLLEFEDGDKEWSDYMDCRNLEQLSKYVSGKPELNLFQE